MLLESLHYALNVFYKPFYIYMTQFSFICIELLCHKKYGCRFRSLKPKSETIRGRNPTRVGNFRPKVASVFTFSLNPVQIMEIQKQL